MKAWKKWTTGALVIAATLPVAGFAMDDRTDPHITAADQREAHYAYQYAHLDELVPTVQYKSNWSAADNVALDEWYTAHGIEFTWEERDGGRYVIADHENNEAREARLAYYDSQIGETFPPDEVAAVNAEVDTIVDALAASGIDAEAPFDEEGFKDLTINISAGDPHAQDLWDRANQVIAEIGG